MWRIARILRSIHVIASGQSIIFECAVFLGPARFVIRLVLVMMHELLYVDPSCPLLICHCNETYNNTSVPKTVRQLNKICYRRKGSNLLSSIGRN